MPDETHAPEETHCPTCHRKYSQAVQRPETMARHDAIVLAEMRARPDRSWREVYQCTGLRSTDAKLARERLIASGQVTVLVPAHGSLGARYSFCSLLPLLLTPKS